MADFDQDRLGELYAAAREAEDRGDTTAAIAGFNACLALDPDDHCGVTMRLAALGEGLPERAPPAYVATLFDQHAEAFDDILVRRLGYDVPALARALAEPLITPPARLLDLGCGTGLVGAAFADVSDDITGVDLAETMLAMADERGVYGDLYIAEVIEFLATWDEAPFDVIVAADVLPYLGDLAPFAAAVTKALLPGGLLIASTESRPEGWGVTQTQRFSHSLQYLRSTFAQAGFSITAQQPITVRHEEGVPVGGDLVALRLA